MSDNKSQSSTQAGIPQTPSMPLNTAGTSTGPAIPIPPRPAVSAPSTASQSQAQTQPQAQPQPQAVPAPAPTLPVAVPGPDYHPPIAGGINAAGPVGKQPKKHNGLLVFGIIVCLIAVVALVISLIFVVTRDKNEPLDVEAPSIATMHAAFESARVSPSNLSSYAYIDTNGLNNPEISDVKAGSVSYGSDGRSATCDATAHAKWENESVSVEQTIQIPFTYNTSANEWQAGTASAVASDQEVTPVGPADIEKLQAALPDLLKDYDAEIAKQFEGAEIAATANLTEKGGEITFALDKANGDNHTQTDVNVGVKWADGKGWIPTINWVGEIIGGDQPAKGEETTDNSSNNGNANQGTSTGSGESGDGAQMLLTCSTGDLVEVPGVIEYRDNHVLLRADYTIRLVLDGQTYITKYFELTANTFVVTNGAHVSVVGEISATGTLEQTPIMINLDYEG